jgi:hypothetical protein
MSRRRRKRNAALADNDETIQCGGQDRTGLLQKERSGITHLKMVRHALNTFSLGQGNVGFTC